MNGAQKLWWEQAKSDHAAFICLRRAGVHECHMLHYLQMAAEKISKAYLWRSGTATLGAALKKGAKIRGSGRNDLRSEIRSFKNLLCSSDCALRRNDSTYFVSDVAVLKRRQHKGFIYSPKFI